MTKKWRVLPSILLLLIMHSVVFSQTIPAVASYSLVPDQVPDHIAIGVNDLVFSFIRELRTYRMLDMRKEPLPHDIGVPDGSDYIFYGTISGRSDGIKLELVLKGGPQMITRIISRVYDNSSKILLESRMLVRDLFDLSISLPDPEFSLQEIVKEEPVESETYTVIESLDTLAGTWIGEPGIEKIMILRGGRGVVVLSSGISLSVELSIDGNSLYVKQKSALHMRQFLDLPDTVARKAVNVAPPLEWIMKLTSDQKTLSGIKKTVSIVNDGTDILSVKPDSLSVVWQRN